jgi:RHS repeat-associated protein
MPNRHGQDDDYRYGFNGHEKDDEVHGQKGSSYNFGARMYDSRVARFNSSDPWEKRYAWQSSYVYFKNSPISQIDWKGLGDNKKTKSNPNSGKDAKDIGSKAKVKKQAKSGSTAVSKGVMGVIPNPNRLIAISKNEPAKIQKEVLSTMDNVRDELQKTYVGDFVWSIGDNASVFVTGFSLFADQPTGLDGRPYQRGAPETIQKGLDGMGTMFGLMTSLGKKVLGNVSNGVDDLLQGGNKLNADDIIAAPSKRGNAPTGKDGYPVELHHRHQTMDGPIDEMTRTAHRGKGNYSTNHPNTGPSLIDRKAFNTQRKSYWTNQWDSNRFK